MRKIYPIGMIVLALTMALSLAGCDKKPGAKSDAQVAAKVNGEAVTVEQLDSELSKLGNLAPEQSQAAAGKVLNALIDRHILAQKAVADKMDSDPQVVQELETARRQVLARVYLQKVTADTPQPTDAEIADYYAKNPALFSERRIYRLQEINVQAGDRLDEIKSHLAGAKNLNDFVQWLKDQKIEARVSQSVKTSEQLPMEILSRFAKMKDGQAMTVVNGKTLDVVVIAASQGQPLTQEQAKPAIVRYLINAKKRAAAEAELKQLREKAKIEYEAGYGEAAKTEPAAPAESTAPAAPAESAAPAPTAPAAAEPSPAGSK